MDARDSHEEEMSLRDYLVSTKESMRVWLWVWHELVGAEGRRWAKRMIVFLMLGNTAMLLQPWMFGRIIDALGLRDVEMLVFALSGAAVLMLLGQVFQYFQFTCREYVFGSNMRSLDRRSNQLFFEKSLGQHLSDNEKLSAASMEKGRARVLEIEDMFLFEGLQALFRLALSYVLLFTISLVAGSIVTALFAIYLAWSLFLNRQVVVVCKPIDEDFRAMNRHRVERWERVERVKTAAKEEEETEHMSAWFGKILVPDRAFWLWFIRQISTRGVVNIVAFITILTYGSWLVINGSWEIGIVAPLYIWTQMIVDNIWQIGNIEHRMNYNMPSVCAMRDALTMASDVVDKPGAPRFERDDELRVVFDSVSHMYPGRLGDGRPAREPRAVLRDVSFTIEPGEVVALLGRSGAGKTTIMRLLLRSMDPTGGAVRVSGQDLRDVQLASWLDLVGYIPQHPAVLDGTIRYNLLYGLSIVERARVTDAKLWQTMRELQIDFGDRLVDGLETTVGRNGLKLSGGEAQRLMIGAAAMKQPRFMIIDEATSSLDSTTERAVQAGLAKVLAGDRGALVIAHRLSTVRDICDKFVVLRRSDELLDGESQVEAVAHSFEELARVSQTFRMLAEDQGIHLP